MIKRVRAPPEVLLLEKERRKRRGRVSQLALALGHLARSLGSTI